MGARVKFVELEAECLECVVVPVGWLPAGVAGVVVVEGYTYNSDVYPFEVSF